MSDYSTPTATPCELYNCPNAEACKVERMSCQAFANYVAGKTYRGQRWPSRKQYLDTMYGIDCIGSRIVHEDYSGQERILDHLEAR